MPNTKIQLRGITRVPSDRLVADGECAESLNVIMHESETAPMARPKDVTEDLVPGLSEAGIDVLFIHKGTTYENYIGLEGSDLVALVNGEKQTIRENTGAPSSITNNGNVLIYSFGSEESDGGSYSGAFSAAFDSAQMAGTGYAVFRPTENEYADLGVGAPFPTVQFTVETQGEEDTEAWAIPLSRYSNLVAAVESITGLNSAKDLWEYTYNERLTFGEASELYDEMCRMVWTAVVSKELQDRDEDIFCAPVLARYALRLYDGSLIYGSEPIILTGDNSHDWVDTPMMQLAELYGQGSNYYLRAKTTLKNRFKLNVSISFEDDLGGWKDLIESVDVFLSTDVQVPNENAELWTGREYPEQIPVTPTYPTNYGFAYSANFYGLKYRDTIDNPSVYRRAFEEEYLKKVNFYKVASYKIEDLPTNKTIKPLSQDELVVLPRMDEATTSHRTVARGALSTYNSRLVSGGQLITLNQGYCQPHALTDGATGSINYYSIVYHVRDEAGVEHLVRGYSESPQIPGDVLAYVAYPDSRCFQADLYFGAEGHEYDNMVLLSMKEHPGLNCSYGFWGLNLRLDAPGQNETERHVVTPTPAYPTDASGQYAIDNRLALSEVSNPFAFAVDQQHTFDAKIIDVAAITTALSSGQFGQFPLYVFTEDGVWAMSLRSDGGLAVPSPISRDVAFPGTIRQLDRAVIFTTDKGVMIIAGSQLKNLSPNMFGRNYVPAADLTGIVDMIVPGLAIQDTTPFLSFVKEATPAYDYAGNRVIFFNKKHPSFQYVLALANQTWHRIRLIDGCSCHGSSSPRLFNVLNSYPECLVFFGDATAERGGKIMDFSTLLNADSEEYALPGLIVTRDINLGGNDAYKTIKRIRVRGDRFPDMTPWRYVLLASNDRKNYRVIHSLRGPSWKFYRIAVITTMQEAGRLSYIEIDWEPRFLDRIR